MKKSKRVSTIQDTDLKKVGRALRLAARDAFNLAAVTGTPFYVYRSGRIVNLCPRSASARRRRDPSKS